MVGIDLDKIREWYRKELGFEIPDVKLIEVPGQYVPEQVKSHMFLIPPIKFWDDMDKDVVYGSFDLALGLLCIDPIFCGQSRNQIESEFEQLVQSWFNEKDMIEAQLQELKTFTEQHDGCRIYVFPTYKEVISKNVGQLYFDCQIAHEFCHIEQWKRGLGGKYPYISEAPAIIVQYLYGLSHTNLAKLKSMNEAVVSGMGWSLSSGIDEILNKRGIAGYNAIQNTMSFTFSPNPKRDIRKFRKIFDMPRYANMEATTIYLLARKELTGFGSDVTYDGLYH